MISTPTDKLHKLAAIGGLVLACGGSAAALQQYHETSLQLADLHEKGLRAMNAYNRFAEVARKLGPPSEVLDSSDAKKMERDKARKQMENIRSQLMPLSDRADEAMVQMQRQIVVAKHYEWMKKLWFMLAAFSIGIGTLVSFWGFKVWLQLPFSER